MPYAVKTDVPVERSKTEIEKILTKYGASAFMFGINSGKAIIVFELQSRRIKFSLPLPSTSEFTVSKYEQVCRSKWRSLLLCIKAKLEAVDSKITTLEQEFLAHIVLPNGAVVGDVMIPQIARSYESGDMPPLLPGA